MKSELTITIWDGKAYRLLPSIPKSREEAEQNLFRALAESPLVDIFEQLKQIKICHSSPTNIPERTRAKKNQLCS